MLFHFIQSPESPEYYYICLIGVTSTRCHLALHVLPRCCLKLSSFWSRTAPLEDTWRRHRHPWSRIPPKHDGIRVLYMCCGKNMGCSFHVACVSWLCSRSFRCAYSARERTPSPFLGSCHKLWKKELIGFLSGHVRIRPSSLDSIPQVTKHQSF